MVLTFSMMAILRPVKPNCGQQAPFFRSRHRKEMGKSGKSLNPIGWDICLIFRKMLNSQYYFFLFLRQLLGIPPMIEGLYRHFTLVSSACSLIFPWEPQALQTCADWATMERRFLSDRCCGTWKWSGWKTGFGISGTWWERTNVGKNGDFMISSTTSKRMVFLWEWWECYNNMMGILYHWHWQHLWEYITTNWIYMIKSIKWLQGSVARTRRLGHPHEKKTHLWR